MENFELTHRENKDGMKVLVSEVKGLSDTARNHLPIHLRKITDNSFKPYGSIFMPYRETYNQKKLAKWLYRNFGARPDGVVYRLNYWRKVNAWSR
ncbi:hypothetical protein COU53_01505, partial [Candidatus Pacearchaeota archaeon CG10_big_fil_rev_8_21_14_0_10_30_48]